MKIAIEAQRIFRTAKHGMDFAALETIRELQKIDHTNQYRIYLSPGDDHCLETTENFEIEVITRKVSLFHRKYRSKEEYYKSGRGLFVILRT